MSDEYIPLARIETHKRLEKMSVKKKIDNTKQRSNFRGRTLSQANKSTDTTVIMIMKKMKSLCFLL